MKTLGKYILIAAALIILLTPAKLSNACGAWDMVPEDGDRVSLFQPGITGNSGLLPFSFSTNRFYGLPCDTCEATELGYYNMDNYLTGASEMEVNLEEWMEYTHGQVPRNAINSIMYETAPATFLHTIDNDDNQRPDPAVASNPLIIYLRKNDKELLDYLAYAKKAEFAFTSRDMWESDGSNDYYYDLEFSYEAPDTSAFGRLIREGEKAIQKVKRPELKIRYGYQLVKLAWYAGRYQDCQTFYDKYVAPQPDVSELKWWALHFTAYRSNAGEMNYILSRVFEKSDGKKFRAMELYDRGKLDSSFPYAKNDHEKAELVVMETLRYPGRALHWIKQAYALDNTNRDLEASLIREVNKLEAWILHPDLTGSGPYGYFRYEKDEEDSIPEEVPRWATDGSFENYQSDRKYLDQVEDFVQKVASSGRNSDPAFWNLAAAYLAYLQRDITLGRSFLGSAEKAMKTGAPPAGMRASVAKKRKLMQELQLRLTGMLLELNETGPVSAELENKLFQQIQWIKAHNNELGTYKKLLRDMMWALYHRYNAADQRGRAALAMAKSRLEYMPGDAENDVNEYLGYWSPEYFYRYLYRHGRPADFDEIVRLMKAKDKTPFEAFLTSSHEGLPLMWEDWEYGEFNSNLSLYRVMDFKGMYYVRRDEMDKAYEVYKQIPDSFWNTEPYKENLATNPFKLNINHPHRTDSTTQWYNKRTALKRILELKDDLKNNRGNMALNNCLLGNAYFNMSWYGSSWMMVNFKWSRQESEQEFSSWQKSEEALAYYGTNRALPYYLAGISAKGDPKASAVCCLMAGYCRQTLESYKGKRSGPEGSWNKHNPYVSIFASAHGNKKVFRELEESCTLYENYIQKVE